MNDDDHIATAFLPLGWHVAVLGEAVKYTWTGYKIASGLWFLSAQLIALSAEVNK